jgi:exosortase A
MSSRASVSWRATYIALGCSLAVLLAVFWRTALSTVALWTEGRYSHGFLVIPIAIVVARSRRDVFERLAPVPALLALPLLALLSLGWLIGNLTATGVVQQFFLVAIIVGFIWGAIGTAAARALVFPLGFLFFAVPIGDRLIPMLQELTASFAVQMLRLTHVPALLEGHVISTPGGSWEVAQACSGISYLFSSLAICYMYAGLAYRQWSHRVALFLLAGVIPLVANGLRVYTVVLIASHGGARIAEGIEHYLYGWLFFAMIVGVTLLIAGRWDEEPRAETPSEQPSAHDSILTNQRPLSIGPLHSTTLFVTVALAVVGAAPLAAGTLWPARVRSTPAAVRPVGVSAPWRPVNGDVYAWRPRFIAPGAELVQSYVSGAHAVQVYAAYYPAGEPGVKLASAGNAVFGAPWRSVGDASVPATIEGRSFSAHETRLQAGDTSLVVWSWYAVDGTFTGNDYFAKVLLARAKLTGSAESPVAIAIATADFVEQADAATILANFLGHFSLDNARRAAE